MGEGGNGGSDHGQKVNKTYFIVQINFDMMYIIIKQN